MKSKESILNTGSKLYNALFAGEAHPSTLRLAAAVLAVALVALVPLNGNAADTVIGGKLAEVAVSGGAPDTYNPGTTCIKLDVPLPLSLASCESGYIAVPNNNSKLVNAALAAKLADRPVSLYMVFDLPAAQASHCPALVFTRCSLISVIVK